MTATQWFEVLCSYACQVFLVVAVAYVLDRNAADARTRSSIWSMTFSSVLCLGCLAILLPRLHLLRPWSRVRPETVLSIAETQVLLGKIAMPLWCLGAAVSLLRWLKRGYLLRRLLRRCALPTAEQRQRILAIAGPRMSPEFRTRVLVSDEVDGPFCWQMHDPTVVLPRFLFEDSDDVLAQVLTHEFEHLKIHHPLQLFLQHVAQVVCWFHPAMWHASRQASLVREFACDDAAVSMGTDTASYLRTLLRIAERSEAKNATLGFGRNRSEVVLRSRRLVDLTQNRRPWKHRRGIPRVATLVAMFLATLAASQMWLPVDALASSRAAWSPWPSWSATTLHSFGVTARDYERFDPRVLLHELREDRQQRGLPQAQAR